MHNRWAVTSTLHQFTAPSPVHLRFSNMNPELFSAPESVQDAPVILASSLATNGEELEQENEP
jgi:hypothetical protein